MRKTFKYRLYPSKAQAESLRVQLSEACRLYNAALQERIEAYAMHRKSINYYDQAVQLTEIRAAGDLGLPNCHCAQEVLRRLDKAFKAFFERVKRKQKAGFRLRRAQRRVARRKKVPIVAARLLSCYAGFTSTSSTSATTSSTNSVACW